jgi:hypothetical protein
VITAFSNIGNLRLRLKNIEQHKIILHTHSIIKRMRITPSLSTASFPQHGKVSYRGKQIVSSVGFSLKGLSLGETYSRQREEFSLDSLPQLSSSLSTARIALSLLAKESLSAIPFP